MDMINIGYSGASTAQVELNVTAQNTANAMTTGYTRQVAEISTIGASGGSPNSAGNGVQVDSIRRVSNQIDVQLRTSEHRSMYSYVRLSIDRCTATYV